MVSYTFKPNEHEYPPKLIEKLAVPAETGVPEIINNKSPLPLAKVPACKVAVKPVTPVETIGNPVEYAKPLPPV